MITEGIGDEIPALIGRVNRALEAESLPGFPNQAGKIAAGLR
jgi:hypothetical protein